MNKKIIGLICAVLASAMVFGACAIKKSEDTAKAGPIPNNDAVITVAKVEDEPVYKDRFNAAFASFCKGQQGIEQILEEPMYADMVQNMKEQVLESLIIEKAMFNMLEEKGYMEFTPEQLDEAKTKVQEELDYYAQMGMASITAELEEGYTDEQYQQKADEYIEKLLTENNITRQDIEDYYKNNFAVEQARKDLVGDIVPTKEQVKEQYDTNVEAARAAMSEDVSAYESYERSGLTIYYVPAGIRKVRQILIKFEDDSISSAINDLQIAGDEKGADELLQESLPLIQERADEVLGKLQSGEITFDEAIENYNDDTGMEYYKEGYTVMEGSTSYLEPFTKGAMALETVGDISGLVPTLYGYHIIEYTSDLEEGPVDYESVRQEIYDSLLASLQDNAWYELVDEWKQNLNIEYFTENL